MSKPKILATTLFALLIFSVFAPAALPATAATQVQTSATLTVIPTSLNFGQAATVLMQIQPAPPAATDQFSNLTLSVLNPDGTTQSMGFSAYSNGTTTQYKPQEAGNFIFQLSYPGQSFANGTITYLPSKSTQIQLTVGVGGTAPTPQPTGTTTSPTTGVNVIINNDTTWTKTNSPYSLTGDLLVNNGANLIVESGVTVNLNNYYIMVNGTLQAEGNGANSITFNGGQITFTQSSINWNEATGTGCIIKNSFLNSTVLSSSNGVKIDSDTINIDVHLSPSSIVSNSSINGNVNGGVIEGNSIKGDVTGDTILNNTITGQVTGKVISNNTIQGEVSIGGSSTVSGNIISGADTGINLSGGSASIFNNTITANQVGVNLADAFITDLFGHWAVANIYGNVIYGCKTDGIQIGQTSAQYGWTPGENGDNGTIHGNVVYDNGVGIKVLSNGVVEGNLVTNNTYGIEGGTLIMNNTITNNGVGAIPNWGSYAYNNIYENNYNIYLQNTSDTTNATFNWWGTTDAAAINQSLYDFKNDFNLGNIFFIPFLTAPNPQAAPNSTSFSLPTPSPSITPTPTSTPSQTPTSTPTPSTNAQTATPSEPSPTPTVASASPRVSSTVGLSPSPFSSPQTSASSQLGLYEVIAGLIGVIVVLVAVIVMFAFKKSSDLQALLKNEHEN